MIKKYMYTKDLKIEKDNNKKYVAIVGSRNVDSYILFKNYLTYILKDKLNLSYNDIIFVSGGSKGIDKYAEKYAQENNINMIVINANWKRYGKGAGYIRNSVIADLCDLCIAFITKESKGTIDTIDKVIKNDKELLIIDYNGIPDKLNKDNYKKYFFNDF